MTSDVQVLLSQIAKEQLAMRRGLLRADTWDSSTRHEFVNNHQKHIDTALMQLLDIYGDTAVLLVQDIIVHTDYMFQREQARFHMKARLSRYFYEQAHTQSLKSVHFA